MTPRYIARTSLLALLAVTLFQAGCASAPVTEPAIRADVVSEPEGVFISFRGKLMGQTPVELPLSSFDEVVEVTTPNDEPPVLERRVKVLGPDRVQVQMRLTNEPSPLAKALGLSGVVIFDYGDFTSFDVDKYELKPEAEAMLRRQAALLKDAFAGVDIYVCGHTDSSGEVDHNLGLSLNRAQAVADFLIAEGVDEARLRVQGFGSDYPIASNADREGKALNRRTELILPD